MNPAGRVVLITGASAGIGAATARAFAAAGANLVLTARNTERLNALHKELAGEHIAIPADLADPSAIEVLTTTAQNWKGRIDLLINNAGIGLASPVQDLNQADFQQALDVNLYGPLRLIRAVVPGMKARRSGQIMIISSVVGLRSLPYLGGYAATKAALDRLTEALRMELLGSGVAVTLVRPGTTRTSFSEHRLGHGHEIRRAGGRGVAPEQVAHAILLAAYRQPRVAYIRFADRLITLAGLLFPGLTDRVLARTFDWEPE